MAVKVSASEFIDWMAPHANPSAPLGQWGYIFGAYGQKPSELGTSYWNQYKDRSKYTASQEKAALNWKANADRVLDCNGCAEGFYLYKTGTNINTRARTNYSTWCAGHNGSKMSDLPKIKGAAVFIYSSSEKAITHVGFLEKPVSESAPSGDWYVLEARGVSYGLVRTKLSERGWNRWGLMMKYFDYDSVQESPTSYDLGERILSIGMVGNDVAELQRALISLDYDLGKWGADGEFGSVTEAAVKSFQRDSMLTTSGIYDSYGHGVLMDVLKSKDESADVGVTPPELNKPIPVGAGTLVVKGASVNVRTGPGTQYAKSKVVYMGDQLIQADLSGWKPILVDGEVKYISVKYVK